MFYGVESKVKYYNLKMINEVVNGETCRFCGTQEGFRVFIFDQESDHIKKIRSILPIEVSDGDALPKFMCYRCTYKLKESYAFQQQCLQTDTLLRSKLSLPSALQNGRSVVLSANWEESVKKGVLLPGHCVTHIQSENNSGVKSRLGTSRKKSSHKRKSSKMSVGNKRSSVSAGNENTENKPFHVKPDNVLVPVKHQTSDTSINESGKSLESPLVEPGFSKNDSSRENSENCTSASVKNEALSGTVGERDREGGDDSKLDVVKSEDADVKIPSNILVTKIPGSCSIYTCQICDRCFVSEEAARKHSCNDSTEVQPPSTQMQSGQADAREYTCEHCNKTFTRYVSLLAHQESHLRCFSDEELDEDLAGEAALLDDASAKKQRKRPLSTSSEEEPVPSNS